MDGLQVAVAVAIATVIFLAVRAGSRSPRSDDGSWPASPGAPGDDGGLVPVTPIGLAGSARGGGMVDDDARPGHSQQDAPDAGGLGGDGGGGGGDSGGGGGDGGGGGGGD